MFKILFFLLLIKSNFSTGFQIEKKLLEKYDKRVRPVKYYNESVNTTFSLKINSLEFFKQKEEKIKFNVELNLYWKDYYLKWDPKENNNIKSIKINPKKIWTPDIELYNSGDYPELWTKNNEARLDYNGNIFLTIPVLFTFSCFLDLNDFPFDEQTCFMNFGSWKFSKKYLDIRVIDPTTYKKPIISYKNFKHNEWDIIGSKGKTDDIEYNCCPGDFFPTSVLTIQLKRKSIKYSIVIIMSILLTFSSINILLLSMEKYRRTFILVFIPLSIIWVQLNVSSKIPVIEHATRMESILMLCYYCCMICSFYSGILFCILNSELKFLDKFGYKINYNINYKNSIPHQKNFDISNNNEKVGRKYKNIRDKIKIIDNLIKFFLVSIFITTFIVLIFS